MKYLDKLFEEKKPLKTTFATKPRKPHQMAPGSERKEFGRLVGKRSKAQHRKTVTGFVKKYGNERPVVPGKPSTNKIPTGIDDHTEYKRMGLLMADSLGYRIDEFLPALAARLGTGIAKGVGAAARGVGNLVNRAATEKAKEKAMEKRQNVVDKVTGQRDDGNGVGRKRMEEASFYFELGMFISENKERLVKKARGPKLTRQSQKDIAAREPGGGFTGPMANELENPKGSGPRRSDSSTDKEAMRVGGDVIKRRIPQANPKKMARRDLYQLGKDDVAHDRRQRGEGLPSGKLPKGASAAMKQRELETPEDNPKTRSRRFPRRR